MSCSIIGMVDPEAAGFPSMTWTIGMDPGQIRPAPAGRSPPIRYGPSRLDPPGPRFIGELKRLQHSFTDPVGFILTCRVCEEDCHCPRNRKSHGADGDLQLVSIGRFDSAKTDLEASGLTKNPLDRG